MSDEPRVPDGKQPKDIEFARSVAHLMANAACGLGLAFPPRLPIDMQLDAILDAAMCRPGAIEPTTYELCFILRFPGVGGGEAARRGGSEAALSDAATTLPPDAPA
jgi:hypothetical protein